MELAHIQAEAKRVKEILRSQQYKIDYYQRDYKWEQKHIRELLNDLTGRFFTHFKPEHTIEEVRSYPTYFLGSFIISEKEHSQFIIDGQQRLTSLTLLLIYLRNHHLDQSKPNLTDYIYSDHFDKATFNIDVPEREQAMDKLLHGETPDSILGTLRSPSPSVSNLLERYSDIEEYFPLGEMRNSLQHFIYWLIEKVELIRITAYSDSEAYTIFETMNDRGLSLTPSDMLKGFILSKITNLDERQKASEIWTRGMKKLQEASSLKGENDFFRDWFRAKYATKTVHGGESVPQDWDRMTAEFHRWFKDEAPRTVGLITSRDYMEFVEEDFQFYLNSYLDILKAEAQKIRGLEQVFYAGIEEFPFFKPIAMAALKKTDSKEVVSQKLNAASLFMEILFLKRIWVNERPSDSGFRVTAVRLTRLFRNKSKEALALYAHQEVNKKQWGTNFESSPPELTNQNKKGIFRILARLTDYVEEGAGKKSLYSDMFRVKGNSRYEIEHILANPYSIHGNIFADGEEFESWRNKLGDLVLLEKNVNASIGNMLYPLKAERYVMHNRLAGSLSPELYDGQGEFKNQPSFNQWRSKFEFDFKAYSSFDKSAISERGELYKHLAQKVWNSERLISMAGFEDLETLKRHVEILQGENDSDQADEEDLEDVEVGGGSGRVQNDVTLEMLVRNSYLPSLTLVSPNNKSIAYIEDGGEKIRFEDVVYSTVSGAALAAEHIRTNGRKKTVNGWDFWHVRDQYGNSPLLTEIRKRYSKEHGLDKPSVD